MAKKNSPGCKCCSASGPCSGCTIDPGTITLSITYTGCSGYSRSGSYPLSWNAVLSTWESGDVAVPDSDCYYLEGYGSPEFRVYCAGGQTRLAVMQGGVGILYEYHSILAGHSCSPLLIEWDTSSHVSGAGGTPYLTSAAITS